MNTEQKQYHTVEQVASLLQVHWQSVLNYIKRGDLEAIKIGRGYRISTEALASFLRQRSTKRDSK
ncbi:MAG TPA: helix-turn-helix domain-containing protein [Candidatus Saccharimonadales bacterium]|nr:helix-turn-helix domain-containing protein [Candidatus Saccharimonadales bacterium]